MTIVFDDIVAIDAIVPPGSPAMLIHVNVSAYADTNLTQLQHSHNQTFVMQAPTQSPAPPLIVAAATTNNEVSAYPVSKSKQDIHQAVLRMATSLKVIGANPNAAEDTLKGVMCDITSR